MTVTVIGPPRLAPRTAQLSGEGALDVLVRARELERDGREVSHLELGQPDWPTPAHIVEAGTRAIRDGETQYALPAGLDELREAIARSYSERGISVEAGQVLVTPGAKPMLLYAALATIAAGDEVLVPDPGFPIYPSLARFLGGVPVSYGLDAGRGFAPDVDEVAGCLTSRTRVLFLNVPSNPTGGGIDHAGLERLGELAARHDLLVIADEIYGRLVYEGTRAPSVLDVPALRDRTIVVDGFSKTYAMTGWRLGWGVVPRGTVDRFVTLAVNGHTCVPPFVQRAGIAALTGSQEPVRRAVDTLRVRRDALVAGLRALPGVSCAAPAGAFYAFPSVEDALRESDASAADLADALLASFGVAVLPGTAFGARGEGHLRISFAASPRAIARAVDALASALTVFDSHAGVRT